MKRKTALKQKAIELRKKNYSYSQIKNKIGVSKSTLSSWLKEYPLSEKEIKRLRDNSAIRIEKYRNTMQQKKTNRREKVYKEISKYLGNFKERDYYLAGLFLYLGEGLKTQEYTISVANTNPVVLKFFIKWLEILGADRKKIRVKLNLYLNMSSDREMNYWIKELGLSRKHFLKPYIKNSKSDKINYSNSFGHGTCNVTYHNRDIADKVKMCLKYVQNMHL